MRVKENRGFAVVTGASSGFGLWKAVEATGIAFTVAHHMFNPLAMS